jgi:uncharacterized protein (DUF2147 family)
VLLGMRSIREGWGVDIRRNQMRGYRSIFAACAIVLIAAGAARGQAAAPAPPDPTGAWLVDKSLAIIRIVACGDQLWGVVDWEAHPGIDRHNPDQRLRTRPTLGLPILSRMKKTKPNRWDGEIYNTEDGHTYSASISLTKPDTLRVQGCFLAILCGGQNWTRVPSGAPLPQHRPNMAGGNTRPPIAAAPTTGEAASADDDVCLRLFGPSRLPH